MKFYPEKAINKSEYISFIYFAKKIIISTKYIVKKNLLYLNKMLK